MQYQRSPPVSSGEEISGGDGEVMGGAPPGGDCAVRKKQGVDGLGVLLPSLVYRRGNAHSVYEKDSLADSAQVKKTKNSY